MKVIDRRNLIDASQSIFTRKCDKCGVQFDFGNEDIIHKKYLLKKSIFYKKNYVTCPYCGSKLKIYGYKFALNNRECMKSEE